MGLIMKNKLLGILSLVALLPILAQATSLAVLDVSAESENVLSSSEIQYLTNVLRGHAIQTLPTTSGVSVVNGTTGTDVACDFVAQSKVGKFGSSLFISVELYEKAGNTLVTSFNEKAENVEALEGLINQNAPAFFRRVLEKPAAPADSTVVPAADSVPNNGALDVSVQLLPNVGDPKDIKVTVDGKDAVLGVNNLDSGKHAIHVEHPCYAPLNAEVEIENQKTAQYSAQLQRGESELTLNAVMGDTTPVKLPVFVNGQKVGETPFVGKVQLCSTVEVEEAGVKKNVPVALLAGGQVAATYKAEKPVVVAAPVKADSVKADSTKAEPAKPAAQKPSKRWWGGVSAGVTYNDFYDTKLGLGNLKNGDDYTLDVNGSGNLLGNFWGIGYTLGIDGMFMVNNYFAVHGGFAFSYKRGIGTSDVTVKLYWNDAAKDPEKSDIEVEYKERRKNFDIPLLARVILPNILYVEAGPLASINFYARNKSTVTDMYGTQVYREKNGLNVVELDAAFGVGTTKQIRKSMLDFNMRFVLGITPISDADDAPKTWQGQFNIGYWFL